MCDLHITFRGRSKFPLCLVAGLLVGGCCYPVRDQADSRVCELAAHAIDTGTPAGAPTAEATPPPSATSVPSAAITPVTSNASVNSAKQAIVLASAQQAERPEMLPPPQRPLTMSERLRIPPELPGANAPPIQLPPPTATPQEKQQAIQRLYPALPELGTFPQPAPGPGGCPLTLAELQRLALTNSPLLRQAAADVEAAKGAAIQAGAYPNPNFGYQSDTAGTGGTAGFQGVFVEQTFKTAGKLEVARAAATMDVHNSELAFRRAQTDLMTQVRTNYFAVLTAEETMKVAEALARFTDEVYRIQVEQAIGVVAAPYEPLQMRVLAYQARGALVQARNRYTAAWKQLATSLGLPAMPMAQLAGRVDMPMPQFRYDAALAHVLSAHTDVRTAENGVQKARLNLRLAQLTPVPDVNLHLAIEKDFSVPPFAITHSINLGIPVPIWDQNKGNIIQTQGQLLRAIEEAHRVRDDLTNRLATAFEQYEDNRALLEYYRQSILPDQVRAYRAIYERHQVQPDRVSFGDVISAQQTLVTTVTTYVTTLGSMWTAVVNFADLLQTDDLFAPGPDVGSAFCVTPVPDLDHLPILPCCHPCSPAPEPALKGANGLWPSAQTTAASSDNSRSDAFREAPHSANQGATRPGNIVWQPVSRNSIGSAIPGLLFVTPPCL